MMWFISSLVIRLYENLDKEIEITAKLPNTIQIFEPDPKNRKNVFRDKQ